MFHIYKIPHVLQDFKKKCKEYWNNFYKGLYYLQVQGVLFEKQFRSFGQGEGYLW